ncbi:MAG: hypothetical protein U0074_05310 [Kouleothrix sp.]
MTHPFRSPAELRALACAGITATLHPTGRIPHPVELAAAVPGVPSNP